MPLCLSILLIAEAAGQSGRHALAADKHLIGSGVALQLGVELNGLAHDELTAGEGLGISVAHEVAQEINALGQWTRPVARPAYVQGQRLVRLVGIEPGGALDILWRHALGIDTDPVLAHAGSGCQAYAHGVARLVGRLVGIHHEGRFVVCPIGYEDGDAAGTLAVPAVAEEHGIVFARLLEGKRQTALSGFRILPDLRGTVGTGVCSLGVDAYPGVASLRCVLEGNADLLAYAEELLLRADGRGQGHDATVRPVGVDGFALCTEALAGTDGEAEGTILGQLALTEDTDHLALVLCLAQIAFGREDALCARHEDDVQPLVLHLHLVVEGPHPTLLRRHIGEVYGHLLLLLAVSVLAARLCQGGPGIGLELRHAGHLAPVLEAEGIHTGYRPGQDPVVAHLLVVDKLPAIHGYAVVIDAHHHALSAVRAVHISHLVGRLQWTVVLIGVLAGRHRIEVAQRGCTDTGEATLPKVALIVQR